MTHSLIHYFETVPNSKKLQTTTEIGLLKDTDCIENIVEKGEIAHFEHFTFSTMFSYGCFLPRRQILDSSKLKEFADDNFKCHENCSKLSKWVENTVGKGEITCFEQFLIFPQCFQKTSTANQGLFGKGF